jgi:CRISPR-associated protein Cas2
VLRHREPEAAAQGGAGVRGLRLRSRLYDIIDRDADQVLFIPLTESGLARVEALGRGTDAHDKNDVVVIL